MNILIIEDNQDHFEHIEDALAAINEINVNITRAETLAVGVHQLNSGKFDICLFDLQLPDSTVAQTISWLKSDSHNTPIVTLTSFNSIDVARDLLEHGIQDYLPKSEITPSLLYRTCRYAIERWKHQRELEDYNQDMQAFCASLSHDFNNHLNSNMIVSELLKTKLNLRVGLGEDELKLFSRLHKNTNTIHRLVTDLQQYLSIGYSEREFKTVDLNNTLAEVTQSFRDTTQNHFSVNIEGKLPVIKGNAALIHLLFHNLIGNSIKFNEKAPQIDLSVQESQSHFRIILQDNGIGFDQKDVQKVFSPFVRLENEDKFSGSGLGLSIVKRVIEHHKGGIHIDSEIGKGSTFTLVFSK